MATATRTRQTVRHAGAHWTPRTRSAHSPPTHRPLETNSAPSSVLSLRGLRAGYPTLLGLRTREVLRGVDFELGDTRRLGLVGPNGSGKSTLLHVLAGIDPATGGEARLFGADPDRLEVRRRVGFLPEESPFPRDMRALRALELMGSLKGLPRAGLRERARAMLERVGLEREARTPLGRFSRGMLRRFGLAQAVLHEPDLLLLDEPAAGLDATGFVVLEQLLAEAGERGARVIVSSHQAGEVLAACERIACLIDGRLVADGTPDQVLSEAGDAGLNDAAIFAVRLAIEEAITNAFVHGHEHVAGDVPVLVEYKISEGEIQIAIEDRGPGFIPETLPDPTLVENLSKPFGRGVMLMKAYMTEVLFNASGNRVKMRYVVS